jgi:hypothetical protein
VLCFPVVANSQASTQPESSRVLGKWSLGISVANIIIGIIGYTLLILWYTMAMLTMFRELAVIAADERNATLLSVSITIIHDSDLKY